VIKAATVAIPNLKGRSGHRHGRRCTSPLSGMRPPGASAGHVAAVDVKFEPSDEGPVVAGEVGDAGSNVLRLAETAHRGQVGHHLPVLGPLGGFQDRCLDEARVDGVDPHAARCPVQCDVLGERPDRALGRVVGGDVPKPPLVPKIELMLMTEACSDAFRYGAAVRMPRKTRV
jgi:hypothetical protein